MSSTEDKVAEFNDRGFCILEDVIARESIDKLQKQSLSNFADALDIIERKKLHFGIGIKNGFKEIVQRHTARFEMPHRMEELDCEWIEQLPSIKSVVNGILGADCIIANKSLVVSQPGSEDQSWHCDGPHMSKTQDLPCHVLNVFIPLVDVTSITGPTQFRPCSTPLTRDLQKMYLAAAFSKRLKPVETPEVAMGAVLLFDYRVLHRGTANRSPLPRPILVITFAKPWFKDVLNFPKRSLLAQGNEEEEGELEGGAAPAAPTAPSVFAGDVSSVSLCVGESAP